MPLCIFYAIFSPSLFINLILFSFFFYCLVWINPIKIDIVLIKRKGLIDTNEINEWNEKSMELLHSSISMRNA